MIVDTNFLTTRLAQNSRDRRAAQRLRYRVFVQELGGDGPLVDHSNRLEIDGFDPFAEQLLLVDNRRDPETADHVVGVYRLLSQDGAIQAGQFYSESEYDLSVLRTGKRNLLELGRSCIDPAFRRGTALIQLWNALADYVAAHEIDVLFGVASFPGVDVARFADHLTYLHQRHLAPADLMVRVREDSYIPMNHAGLRDIERARIMATMPPLIKAYLRIGGYVGDGAFVDRAFNTTDICLVLDTARMTERQKFLAARKAQ